MVKVDSAKTASKCFLIEAISNFVTEFIFSRNRSFDIERICSMHACPDSPFTDISTRVGQSFFDLVKGITITELKALFMEFGLTIKHGRIPSCSLPLTGYNFILLN